VKETVPRESSATRTEGVAQHLQGLFQIFQESLKAVNRHPVFGSLKKIIRCWQIHAHLRRSTSRGGASASTDHGQV
jgi:hypothetical protein